MNYWWTEADATKARDFETAAKDAKTQGTAAAKVPEQVYDTWAKQEKLHHFFVTPYHIPLSKFYYRDSTKLIQAGHVWTTYDLEDYMWAPSRNTHWTRFELGSRFGPGWTWLEVPAAVAHSSKTVAELMARLVDLSEARFPPRFYKDKTQRDQHARLIIDHIRNSHYRQVMLDKLGKAGELDLSHHYARHASRLPASSEKGREALFITRVPGVSATVGKYAGVPNKEQELAADLAKSIRSEVAHLQGIMYRVKDALQVIETGEQERADFIASAKALRAFVASFPSAEFPLPADGGAKAQLEAKLARLEKLTAHYATATPPSVLFGRRKPNNPRSPAIEGAIQERGGWEPAGYFPPYEPISALQGALGALEAALFKPDDEAVARWDHWAKKVAFQRVAYAPASTEVINTVVRALHWLYDHGPEEALDRSGAALSKAAAIGRAPANQAQETPPEAKTEGLPWLLMCRWTFQKIPTLFGNFRGPPSIAVACVALKHLHGIVKERRALMRLPVGQVRDAVKRKVRAFELELKTSMAVNDKSLKDVNNLIDNAWRTDKEGRRAMQELEAQVAYARVGDSRRITNGIVTVAQVLSAAWSLHEALKTTDEAQRFSADGGKVFFAWVEFGIDGVTATTMVCESALITLKGAPRATAAMLLKLEKINIYVARISSFVAMVRAGMALVDALRDPKQSKWQALAAGMEVLGNASLAVSAWLPFTSPVLAPVGVALVLGATIVRVVTRPIDLPTNNYALGLLERIQKATYWRYHAMKEARDLATEIDKELRQNVRLGFPVPAVNRLKQLPSTRPSYRNMRLVNEWDRLYWDAYDAWTNIGFTDAQAKQLDIYLDERGQQVILPPDPNDIWLR